jgi:hypothetical protein
MAGQLPGWLRLDQWRAWWEGPWSAFAPNEATERRGSKHSSALAQNEPIPRHGARLNRTCAERTHGGRRNYQSSGLVESEPSGIVRIRRSGREHGARLSLPVEPSRRARNEVMQRREGGPLLRTCAERTHATPGGRPVILHLRRTNPPRAGKKAPVTQHLCKTNPR